jgi:hypothetical protein
MIYIDSLVLVIKNFKNDEMEVFEPHLLYSHSYNI